MDDYMSRPWRIFVLSNTHWDREWYMSHEKYLVRLVGLWDSLLPILASHPDYIFVTDGQYAMVGDYLAARPDRRQTVESFVRNGQLLIGPWFTQPLETIVSGEGMVRNLQYGIRASAALGGVMRCSYMIDEFGHASQTPQILRGFDIDSAIAWRGISRDSRSVFHWYAPDGSYVDMFFSNDGYGEATSLPSCEEEEVQIVDGQIQRRPGLAEKVPALVRFRAAHADTDCLLWLNGIDHSWAQPDILEVIDKINALFPKLTVRQVSPLTFVAEVRRDYAEKKLSYCRVTGELMNPNNDVLESTHALHARQKKAQANTERYLTRRMEPLCAFDWLLGGENAAWGMERAWTYLLENHAHDSLGCSSVDEVYEEVMGRYRCASSLSEQLTENALRGIMARGGDGASLWFFNSTTSVQSGVHTYTFDLPETMGVDGRQFRLLAPDGSVVSHTVLNAERISDIRYQPRRGHPTRIHSTRVTLLIDLPAVPAFGWLRLTLESAPERMLANRRRYYHTMGNASFENDYLAVSIAPDGGVALTDKERGATYTGLFRLEDDGEGGDCYVHCTPRYDSRLVTSTGAPARISELYDTPEGTAWQIDLSLTVPADTADPKKTRRSAEETVLRVTETLTLYHTARRLDAEITVNNTARNHRLRLVFPTGLTDATVSRGGQPFDFVERPIHEEPDTGSREQPYATHPMQDICDVCDGKRGLALFSADTYEYECTDNAERALAITLLRAVDVIDCGEFAENPDFRMTQAQVPGELSWRISVFPHGGDLLPLHAEADAFLLPPLCRVNRAPETSVMQDYVAPPRTLTDMTPLLSTDNPALRITGVMKAHDRDSLIVRILNVGDTALKGHLLVSVPGKSPAAAYITNLEERRLEDRPITDGTIALALRHAGILTLELVFNSECTLE